jgi:hypothetical protein
MIISEQSSAEDIVNKNPNLSWDGWNIVHRVQDDYAEYLPVGVFDNLTLQWYRQTVYPCTEMGWELPESVM